MSEMNDGLRRQIENLQLNIPLLSHSAHRFKRTLSPDTVDKIMALIHKRDEARNNRHALEQRLVELDLLEQAINQGRDISKFKLQRLADLTKRLDQLTNPDKGNNN